MSQESDRAGLPDSVEYQPLPNIYRAFAAGVSPYAILTETIDNSIDFVRRQALNGAKYPDELRVSITYESGSEWDTVEQSFAPDIPVEERGEGRLVITDNAGGVPPDELSRFFQLGHTDAPPEGIGRFGVGAKRLIGIGDRIRYESHANGYQVGAGFEVDASELESEDGSVQPSPEETYQSDVYRVDGLEEGSTRIIVEELNSNVWSTLLGRDEEGEIDETTADSLWRLGETYEHFLSNGIDVSPPSSSEAEYIEFDLSWGDSKRSVTVDSPAQVEFSLLPFDGLHPRRYESIPFANQDDISPEEAIRADITVGLMPSSDPQNAGLTVTMNNRNVLFRDTENDLFSTRYLGKFRESAGHGRLYCVVELYGPPEDMPWSDTKDGLDYTEEVTSHILNIIENALNEYRRQSYGTFPKWMLSPYAETKISEYEATIREEFPDGIEVIDKSNSKVNNPRFNSKPGESRRDKYYRAYPERDRLIKTVRLHAELRIRADDVISPKGLPAYREFFLADYDHGDPTELSPGEYPQLDAYEIPTDDDEEIPLISDLEKLATEHRQDGTVLTTDTEGVPQWLLPRYTEPRGTDHDDTDAEVLDSFDFLEWRRHNSTSEDIRVQPEPRAGESPEQDNETVPASTAPDRSSETSGTPPQGHRQQDLSDTVSASTDRKERAQTEREVREPRHDPDGEPEYADSAARARESTARGSRYQFTEEQIETLSELVDIDSEPDPDELFETLVGALEEREEFLNKLEEVSNYVDLQALLDDPPELREDPFK